MANTRADRGFTALKIEGGILPPEFLHSVATLQAPMQTGTDYGLSKSLAIKEELSRYWRIANDIYGDYSSRRHRHNLKARQVDVEEWLVPFLRYVLGYADLTAADNVVLDDRVFSLTHRACEKIVPLLLVQHDFDLDRPGSRLGEDGRRHAPHGMMQEYLNTENAALWGMVSNGSKLRILRDNPSLTRPSYIEANLGLIFEEELYPDFATLWLIAHSSRYKPLEEKPSSCIIESWRAKAQETGERIRENLRDGVTDALRQIGNGFLRHPANTKLRESLKSGTLSSEQYFQQLLRLIYRLLFLFTAEERNLLHAPDATERQKDVFTNGYALSRLRERALRRRHYDGNRDLWQGLKITFAALATGAPGLGLPPLGGLFREGNCPDLTESAISNEFLLEAVRSLAFFRSGNSLSRVNYRDMGTEELGSVYENLLELHPVIDVNASPWSFAFIGDSNDKKTKGSARKLTGSYYTPPSLVSELIKSTLDPVIADAIKSHPEDPRSAILDLKIVDPACGSGHFLLAAARRLAAAIAHIDTGTGTSNENVRQYALREVVQHCIYGVDQNPLAVELCKTALWIETVEPGKPLTFLDSHILQGNSLVGILDPEILANGIPNDAYKPLTGDDKAICLALKNQNRQPDQEDLFSQDTVLEVAVSSLDLDAMPEDTLDDIERKRAAWKAGYDNPARMLETMRADLFTGAFFAPKTRDTSAFVPQSQDLQRLGSVLPQRRGINKFVNDLSAEHDFFHWHLAFAEIMQDGGFDVVLGNPPWERIKLQEQEFFASRSPIIAAAPNKSARNRLIQHLNREDAMPSEKSLYLKFETAKREAEAASQFVRNGGRFPLSGIGDVNTYAAFAETILQLVHPRGRAGMIVPTGIATDHSTKAYFDHIVSQRRLVSLFDFENREGVFPGVHRSYKFCLLALSGRDRLVPEAEFAFFLHQTEQLKEAERRFTLSTADFLLFNPNTKTCPTFRTRRDKEIAVKMYRRAGVFWKEGRGSQTDDNPWGVSFQAIFHMSNDSGLFKTRQQMEENGWELEGNVFVRGDERYLPLYEAKLFHQYDHRFATFDGVSERDLKNGNARAMTPQEKTNLEAVVLPRYWVPEVEVEKKLDIRTAPPPFRSNKPNSTLSQTWRAARSQRHYQIDRRTNWCPRNDTDCSGRSFGDDIATWLFSFRDIAGPTNQRTAIFTVLRTTAMNHKAPLLHVDYESWLQAFRGITRSTDERSLLSSGLPYGGVGNSAPVIALENARAVASALILANMNSLPLDWTARLSVGGVNLSFFIVKQLPVLPPEAYLKESTCGQPWVQLVVPRVLELTYTSTELTGFANDLGYEGTPFSWNEERRHRLQCELDAIFAHMYGLNRDDLEWILDAPPPSSSFPSLKQKEISEFGEYRTQRYVLQAFDALEQGKTPDLPDEF